ncbi:MAG: family 16 glycosylhydrolase [Pseudomonadales bacterium]
MKSHCYTYSVFVALVFLSGWLSANTETPDTRRGVAFQNDSLIWAVNVGGPEYVGVDGISYGADTGVVTGEVEQIAEILGSQDSFIYKSYRFGDVQIHQPIENGVYNISFKFAEPEDVGLGGRVFSVMVEGQKLISNLDVRSLRDGQQLSAHMHSTTDIEVSDGQLDIVFEASAGKPILNAFIVRKTVTDPRPWQLVWSDEFDYEGAPDTDKWNIDIWPAMLVNGEDQTYTDRAKNVRVEDGKLILEAYKEPHAGAEYSSGRIHSQGKGDFLYGKAEIRAKIPAGQGTWPAIWMLPSDPYKYSTSCEENEAWHGSSSCDAWPNSGEIDIMEHVGFDMNRIHGSAHNKAYYWENFEQRKGIVEGQDLDKAFHLYSIEWTPDDMTIMLDGNPFFYYSNEKTGWRAWPYDHPYHIILNLAVGGFWGRKGGPIDDSIFPVRMEVDYVRVFKLIENG